MKLQTNVYVADLSAMPATAVLPMLCKTPIGRKKSKKPNKNEYKRLMYVKVSTSYIQNVFDMHCSRIASRVYGVHYSLCT
jgi:hypothetical protein